MPADPERSEAPTPIIEPIRFVPSYQLAADKIRRAIELGTYMPHDRLPPSRELAEQLGISVATLREALRGLLDEGLVEMRRGPKGGVVVRSRPKSPALSKRAWAARLAEVEKILDLREALECQTARLAAIRRTDADMNQLEQALDAMNEVMRRPDQKDWVAHVKRADVRFHQTVAAAAANDLLAGAIEDAQASMFAALGRALHDLAPEAYAHHEDLLRAIRRARPEPAARATKAHIQATRDGLARMTRA